MTRKRNPFTGCSKYLVGTALALLANAPGALGQSGAMAQTPAAAPEPAPAPANDVFKEIIVTARRANESIQKVPVAVTAFAGADLDRLVVNGPQDVNKLGPSITTNGTGISRNVLAPSIRGLSTSQASNTPSVVTYFAEVPYFQQSFFDLENLQVLKGPQGTLFGETAVGGALLFTPRKPDNALSGYASVQGGNYDYRQFEGALGGAIVEDRIMVRAAVQHRARDGFTRGITSYGGGVVDLDNLNTTQWRVSLVVRPTDTIENYTIYAGSHRKTHGTSSALIYFDPRFMNPAAANFAPASTATTAARFEFLAGYAPPAGMTWAQLAAAEVAQQRVLGPRAVTTNLNLAGASNFEGLINQTRWEISDDLTFRNIVSLSSLNQIASYENASIDGDLPLLDNPVGPFIPGTRTARSVGQQALVGGIPRYLPKQFTEEAQFQGKLFDGKLVWQAGAYYRKSKDKDWGLPQASFTTAFGAPANDPATAATCTGLGVTSPCSTITRRQEIAYAFYGQGTYAVTPDIHLTAGYRRSYDKSFSQTAATNSVFVNFNGVDIAIPVAGRQPLANSLIQTTRIPRASHDSYTFTADWQVSPNILLYLAHRMGYKPGGINAAIPNESDPNRTYKPEKIKDVELGIKSRWQLGGMSGTTNIALFQNWYSAIQQSNLIPGGVSTIITNNAQSHIRGLEIESTVAPTSWFRLSGSFSYIDYKYTDWLENSICSRQFWRPQCVGLPGTAPVVIDHARGQLTINGGTPILFTPDLAPDVSKFKWMLQPSLVLKDVVGEDITFGANIYARTKFTNFVANMSTQAGLSTLTEDSVIGPRSNAYIRKGYTLVDLSAEWRNISGSRFSARAAVTNLFNKVYAISANNAFTTIGMDSAILGEPRMGYVELKVEF